MHGVVLEEVGEGLGARQVVDGHEVDIGVAGLLGATEDVSSDTSESVDRYPDRHAVKSPGRVR